MDDRYSIIKIAGKEYKLILTTLATKEIGKKYGGLEKLGDKLMRPENFELAISEISWLIMTLANQNIMIENLKSPNEKQELLTQEYIELMTAPNDLATYKDAIMEAFHKGVKREIQSEEENPKNESVEQMT